MVNIEISQAFDPTVKMNRLNQMNGQQSLDRPPDEEVLQAFEEVLVCCY